MRTFSLVFFLISIQLITAQNYKSVDSLVDSYPEKFKSIELFAERINSDFETDLEKTRAAYYWIANHISYDYKMYYNNGSAYKSVSYSSEEEYEEKQLKQEIKYAELCLRNKKAICEGYSQLLKFTLLKLNIECDVVTGFSKNSIREIGIQKRIANHAWNAVRLNNEWKLIDATWSTGNRDDKPLQFNFNDAHFLAEPKSFILNHFPENKKWQLLKEPITRTSFFDLPIVYSYYFNSGLEISTFNKGELKVNSDKTIELRIKKVDTSKTYKYNFKNEKHSSDLNFKKNKSNFTIKIPYTKSLGQSIMILDNDGYPIIGYKIQ